jgi:hypothetical protein
MAIGHHMRRALEEQHKRAAEAPMTQTPTPEPEPVETPAVARDMAAMVQLLAAALQQGTAAAIAEAKPKIKSIEDSDYDRKSAFNPAGDRLRPRPGLKVPTFWGVLADKDNEPPIPLYEIESAQTTYDEQILLNQLQAGRGDIGINDGTKQPYEIYMPVDRVTKQPIKCVIGLPKALYEKQNRNALPPLKRLAAELVSPAA